MDEDFLASYQMNYGFTPDGEQAVTVSSDSQTAGPHVPQIVQSQVQIKHSVLFTFLYKSCVFTFCFNTQRWCAFLSFIGDGS